MPGRIYIQKQTQLKPENMAEVLQERKKKELQTMMDSGAIDVIAAFDDYALFGDSRAYGLKSYGVLDPDFVYAEAGHTILNCTDYKDVIQQTRPARLVFSYGVNDMGLEIGGMEIMPTRKRSSKNRRVACGGSGRQGFRLLDYRRHAKRQGALAALGQGGQIQRPAAGNVPAARMDLRRQRSARKRSFELPGRRSAFHAGFYMDVGAQHLQDDVGDGFCERVKNERQVERHVLCTSSRWRVGIRTRVC